MNTAVSLRHTRCERQGRLFELMAKRGLDMKDFASKYMNSEFCLDYMDGEYSRFQVGGMNHILDELDDEFLGTVPHSDNPCPPAVAEWIGYIYRRIEIDSKIPSNIIYREHPFDEMFGCYPGFHTLPISEAAEQLAESIEKVME